MQTKYEQITNNEREEISRSLATGTSITEISTELGRHRTTIYREIKRNSGKSGYRAFSASRRAQDSAGSRRRGKTRLEKDLRLRTFVLQRLKQPWSPRAISERLKVEYPLDMEMRISHEAIYQYFYVLPRGELKRTLIQALRQEHAYRHKHKTSKPTETRGKIADMLSIEERPAEVEERTVPGHWEGDLILGKNKQSALGTLVERTTRYTILVPLRDKKDAESVREAFEKAFYFLPVELKKSLTYDQGKEMSEHQRFTIDTGIMVYFAHPSSPWERGTNENTNGLLRQYFPKGTDFANISTSEIERVQRLLNDRPRAILSYLKPDEVITEKRGKFSMGTSISDRPAEVKRRQIFGHWELDTMVSSRGESKGCFATFVERKSRLYTATMIANRTAESMKTATKELFHTLPKGAFKTGTTDRGKEFACYSKIQAELELTLYFADAYSSWQRGTNENSNGLLREFYPKKTNLAKVNQQELTRNLFLINSRPRKCLGWKSPIQVFLREVAHLT